MRTIGEIIVEKRAARGTVWSEGATRRSRIRDTKDDEVVHYTAEQVYKPHYVYSSGRRHAYCMRSALTIGVVRDLRLVLQTFKMRRQNTTVCTEGLVGHLSAWNCASCETFDVPRPPSQSHTARTLRWPACGGIRSGIVGLRQCQASEHVVVSTYRVVQC
jgi:hypothetical protein